MKITTSTIKALRILSENPKGLTARWFAQKMWKDSRGWKKSYNTGNGACKGKGMWLCAGGYLAKLEKEQWVRRELSGGVWIWTITLLGNEILADDIFKHCKEYKGKFK